VGPQALEGIRVLDLSGGIAGPFCARLLGDLGAEVLKVEPPDGAPGRRLAPFVADRPHTERGGLFLFLNANKRGITLDPATATGRRLVLALAQTADLLVESYPPGTLDRLGLGRAALRAANPGLVVTSLSDFGQTGPYRDWLSSDLIAYGMGGALHASGLADLEPVQQAADLIYFQAGNVAAAASLGALLGGRRAEDGGRMRPHPPAVFRPPSAQQVDLNLFESQAGSIDRRLPALVGYQYTGASMRRAGGGGNTAGILPHGIFPCRDGLVYFIVFNHNWARFVTMLGRPDLAADRRFIAPDARLRPELQAELDDLFYPWVLVRTKAEVTREAQAVRVPAVAVNTLADLLEDPHFRARGFWVEADHPFAGRVTYPGAPFQMGEGGWRWRGPAPTLGQDNRAVYCGELGLTAEELGRLREAGVV
jgi:crotonobetainyl-CoA:carnitine CoA-transferase CaiB-like acyl-CoA transferase